MPAAAAPSKQQADQYKRIVRMLARAFYTRNVPEKDPNAPEPRTDIQRRKAKEVLRPKLRCYPAPEHIRRQCSRAHKLPLPLAGTSSSTSFAARLTP